MQGPGGWNPATHAFADSATAIYRAYVRQIGAGAVAAGGFITLLKTLPTIVSSFKESVASLRQRDGQSGQPLVGAIPPGVVGAVVHVAVLVGRGADSAESEPVRGMTEDGVDDPSNVAPWEDRAAQLLTAGAGRRRLAAELGIPEHRARALLASHRAQARGGR